MKRKDFDERMKVVKPGDWIILEIYGMYGRYRVEGKLEKVDERGFVYLDKHFAHSYRKIRAIILT